jgi:hypothetical protein
MSIAAASTVLGVINLVGTLAPQLVNDAAGLTTLYNNASTAVANAAPDGTVSASDWSALLAQEASLQATLNGQVAADAASAG